MRKNKKIQDLLKQIKRLKQLSLCDELTGLFNRRQLKIDLNRYLDLNKRHGIKFSILMIDVDNFKSINDNKGHKFGDKVLKLIALTIKNTIRQTDKCYRLEGDEFIVILSHHTAIDTFIKRLNYKLAEQGITVSIGHCYICKDCLEIIDANMYKMKRGKK